jgi:hypothetical protein
MVPANPLEVSAEVVSEERTPEEDLNTEERNQENKKLQIEQYQTKADDCTKKITRICADIRVTEYLLSFINEVKCYAQKEQPRWHEPAMVFFGDQTSKKNALQEKKQCLMAQREGYLEFINKLQNDEQLELNL